MRTLLWCLPLMPTHLVRDYGYYDRPYSAGYYGAPRDYVRPPYYGARNGYVDAGYYGVRRGYVSDGYYGARRDYVRPPYYGARRSYDDAGYYGVRRGMPRLATTACDVAIVELSITVGGWVVWAGGGNHKAT